MEGNISAQIQSLLLIVPPRSISSTLKVSPGWDYKPDSDQALTDFLHFSSQQTTPITRDYALWTPYDETVGGFYEPRSKRYDCSQKRKKNWHDKHKCPQGVEGAPVTGDSSNFRVACKRHYLVELLHTHVMDFPSRRFHWYLSGGKHKKMTKSIVWCSWQESGWCVLLQDSHKLVLQPEETLSHSTKMYSAPATIPVMLLP